MPENAGRLWRVLGLLALVALGVWFFWERLTGSLSSERVGPKPSAGRHVVVLMHGHGAPADDLVGLAKELAVELPETSFVMPRGPHSAGFGGRTWVPEYSAPSREEYVQRLTVEISDTRAKLWKLIASLRSKGVACDDLYLGGFSLGGRMAVEAALTAPADCHLAGVIVMSGGGLNEAELPSGDGVEPMRVLVTHGSSDGVVPMGTGQATARALAAQGHDVRWLQFQGQHQIPPEVRQAVSTFLRGEPVGVPPP